MTDINIGAIVEVLNQKADLDLGNINPSVSTKTTIVNWGSPDMTTGVTVPVGVFTPDYDGYLSYTVSGSSGGGDFNLEDGNGNIIFNVHPDYSNKHGGMIRLSKGTTYEITTSNLSIAIFTFYKCNGEV